MPRKAGTSPSASAICASPAYLASRGRPHTVTDLKQHNCLGYTLAQAGSHRWIMGRRSDISVPASGNLRANNGDALLAAAISGQGIVQEPTFIVADALRSGELPDRHPPAKVRAFIDFLAKEFAPEPPWDRGLVTGAGGAL